MASLLKTGLPLTFLSGTTANSTACFSLQSSSLMVILAMSGSMVSRGVSSDDRNTKFPMKTSFSSKMSSSSRDTSIVWLVTIGLKTRTSLEDT